MLQMLYQTSGAASQMYMLLIVILMLSEDPTFSSNVHLISLQNTPWYTERLLKDTSLGKPLQGGRNGRFRNFKSSATQQALECPILQPQQPQQQHRQV